MSITAVVNQKGGVGKTTVALGLTAALSSRGAKVLVVDLDPQANASTGLGVFDSATSIDHVLAADSRGAAGSAVVPAAWPTDAVGTVPSVVPSSPALAPLEHQLHSDVIGAQDRLATALSGVADDFDEVIIDCPPSLGLLTVNALFASERVVVVTEPAAWSSDGVEQILRNVGRIAERRGGSPTVAGIVINRLGRTRDAGYWAAELSRTHPGLVLATAIRMRAAVAESSAQSLPVSALSRSGAPEAAAEFDSLAAEVFETHAAVEVPATGDGSEAEPVIDLSGDLAGVGAGAGAGITHVGHERGRVDAGALGVNDPGAR
ncbi:MAG: ParA family protein [Microthrixaceae bacterium]